MHRLKLFSGIFFLILLSACGKYKDIEVGELQDFAIKGFEENALILHVKVPVYNPSIYKITISDLDAKVFINKQYLGKVQSTEPVILPRKSDNIYELVLHVRLANFLGMAMRMMNLRRGQEVDLRLQGSFVAKSMLIKKKVDIDESRLVVL